MAVSLATVTPNVLAPDKSGLHTVRQAKGKLVCIARDRAGKNRCTFVTQSWSEAIRHVTDRQWTAWRDLPADLQLTPEQM